MIQEAVFSCVCRGGGGCVCMCLCALVVRTRKEHTRNTQYCIVDTAEKKQSFHAARNRLRQDYRYSLLVVRLVERPLQVQPVAGGDSQVHLHGEERLGEVFRARLPSNAIYRRGHLTPKKQTGEGNEPCGKRSASGYR